MNRIISTAVIAGIVGLSMQAMADDPAMSSSKKADMMKQCMERQKASNSSMTQAAMETVCKNEMKNPKKTGNDLATGTQEPKPPQQ